MTTSARLKRSIRNWILFFMIALIFSGLTAFALEAELAWLNKVMPEDHWGFHEWIGKVYFALKEMNSKYPFLAYGYDWLGFAHLVIAVVFIGPLIDPVRNIWILQFGLIACAMVFPLAFVAGYIRGIPFFWQLIDCSFGAIALIPLCICLKKIKTLEILLHYGK
jgi:hypothetical protein